MDMDMFDSDSVQLYFCYFYFFCAFYHLLDGVEQWAPAAATWEHISCDVYLSKTSYAMEKIMKNKINN